MAPVPTNTPVTAHPIGTRHVLFPVQQVPGLGLVILIKLNLIIYLFIYLFIYTSPSFSLENNF
jgi:hypothetical protein